MYWVLDYDSTKLLILSYPKSRKDNIQILFEPNDSPSADDTNYYVNFVTNNSVPWTLRIELVQKEPKLDVELQSIKCALKTNHWSSTTCKSSKEIRHKLTENVCIILLKREPNKLTKTPEGNVRLTLLIKAILVLLKQLIFLKQDYLAKP